MKIVNNYVMFFSGKDICSNFHYCPLVFQGFKFFCTEQIFMWEKAVFFKDHEIANKILNAKTPKEAKSLGRLVKNYDDTEWNSVREEMMFKALCCKFEQYKPFMDFLVEHRDKTFVEASPYDRIWGVGLSEENSRILDEKNWLGENKLGKCIMNVIKYYRL